MRYQPYLVLERDDGFWPVSVTTIDRLSGGGGPCLRTERDAACDPISVAELPWSSGPSSAYIDYPAKDTDPGAQRQAVLRALGGGGLGGSAQLYFFLTGRGRGSPISLQYWFYYPYNYLPARFLGHSFLNTDLHEGDFEGVSILLSARTRRPVYVWMPRHTSEGERYVWGEGALERRDEHPVGYVARGSHATYGSCGRKFRAALIEEGPAALKAHHVVFDVPDDRVSCSPEDRYELGPTLPVLNLARTAWACFPGHFGAAPHYGAPRNQYHADGPRSPLFQQKFDLDDPRACDSVDQPAAEGGREIVAGRETAEALGLAGGRLDTLFNRCQDWRQRPAEGSYLLACDQETLSAFFDSGLEDRGRQALRIGGDPAPSGPSVPAVFESREPGAVDLATIRTAQLAHPVVYVAVRDGDDLRTAEFERLELEPGQRLQLQRPNRSEWRLVDAAAPGRVVASAEVRVTRAATPPGKPTISAAVRRRASIELIFSGSGDPAVRMDALAGASRQELRDSPQLVGSVRGEASGRYRLTVPDPARAIRVLRIVASRDGAQQASAPMAVSATP